MYCNGRFPEKKKQKDVSKTIMTAKMVLFVALDSSFQLLISFALNPNSAMGVLNAPLEYYNIFRKLCG